MKVKAAKVETGFKPVKLEVTLESRYELEAMYALFNFAPVCSAMQDVGIDAEQIRLSIEDGYMYSTGASEKVFDIIEKKTKRLP